MKHWFGNTVDQCRLWHRIDGPLGSLDPHRLDPVRRSRGTGREASSRSWRVKPKPSSMTSWSSALSAEPTRSPAELLRRAERVNEGRPPTSIPVDQRVPTST